jgi:hypothetical protein
MKRFCTILFAGGVCFATGGFNHHRSIDYRQPVSVPDSQDNFQSTTTTTNLENDQYTDGQVGGQSVHTTTTNLGNYQYTDVQVGVDSGN